MRVSRFTFTASNVAASEQVLYIDPDGLQVSCFLKLNEFLFDVEMEKFAGGMSTDNAGTNLSFWWRH